MATAQYLLIRHGVLPGDFYGGGRSPGERLLVRALINDYTDRLET